MTKQTLEMQVIKNARIYWVKLGEPSESYLTYNAKTDGVKFNADSPFENTEYSVEVAMPEAEFKKLKKGDATKGAIQLRYAKEYTAEEFKAKYHEDSEAPDLGDDIVTINLKSKCTTAAGKVGKKVKLMGIKGKVQDHNGKEVNQDTNCGNGTGADVYFRAVEIKAGLNFYPYAVIVTDLHEYSGGSGVSDDEFGFEELDEVSNLEDDDDDDIPF